MLEPIVNIEVTAPAENIGDIAGDLAGKRGRVLGQDMLPGNMLLIKAQVPLSEVTQYNSQLKSVTGGRGSYSMSLSHYEPVPPHTQASIVAAYAKPKHEGIIFPRKYKCSKECLFFRRRQGRDTSGPHRRLKRPLPTLTPHNELRNIDTLDYANKLFQNLYSKAYIELVDKAPAILGWLYDHFNKPWQNQQLHLAFDKLNVGPLIKLLTEFKPTLAVCTHFLPAEIISWLREKRRLRTRQAIIITDFDLHAMWLCRHYEHYFVALEETRLHLQALGISPEKITVSGIPIDPVFAEKKDKAEMRKKHGLDIESACDSYLSRRLWRRSYGDACQVSDKNAQQDPGYRNLRKKRRTENSPQQTQKRTCPKSTLKVFPVGYTTEMDEYMSAADLLLGKPGGLTTSEALAKALPLVIVNPIRGQEERNSDHLLEEGAAIRCNNLPVLGYKIDSLLDNPQRLALMRKNVRRLAQPQRGPRYRQKTPFFAKYLISQNGF